MKYTLLLCICFVYYSFFFPHCARCSEPLSIDPHIPDGEKIIYQVSTSKESYPLIQRTIHIDQESKSLYEIISQSGPEDTIARIDRKQMIVVYFLSTRKGGEYIVKNETKVTKNSIKTDSNEIILPSFSGINQVLRGFPFDTEKSFKVRSQESGGLTMIIRQKKEVSVNTKIGEIPCYMLEISIAGFLGNFLPKTYFWYSKKPPHYCVKFKGQPGPPGSPVTTIELVAYEGDQNK
jgi:hypothetical protein